MPRVKFDVSPCTWLDWGGYVLNGNVSTLVGLKGILDRTGGDSISGGYIKKCQSLEVDINHEISNLRVFWGVVHWSHGCQ